MKPTCRTKSAPPDAAEHGGEGEDEGADHRHVVTRKPHPVLAVADGDEHAAEAGVDDVFRAKRDGEQQDARR